MKLVKSKFKNIRTIVDDITFPSKKEAARYSTLKVLKQSGKVQDFCSSAKSKEERDFLTYEFGCGVKYILDFVVKWDNGDITYEDVKGFKTPEYKIKKKMMLHEFDIDITEK